MTEAEPEGPAGPRSTGAGTTKAADPWWGESAAFVLFKRARRLFNWAGSPIS